LPTIADEHGSGRRVFEIWSAQGMQAAVCRRGDADLREDRVFGGYATKTVGGRVGSPAMLSLRLSIALLW